MLSVISNSNRLESHLKDPLPELCDVKGQHLLSQHYLGGGDRSNRLYCNCIVTQVGVYDEISPEPEGFPEGSGNISSYTRLE